MISVQASNNDNTIDGDLAIRFIPEENNSQQVEFKQALRDFMAKLMPAFGSNSKVFMNVNGTMDHGGGEVAINLSILNYGSGTDTTSQPATGSGAETKEPEPDKNEKDEEVVDASKLTGDK